MYTSYRKLSKKLKNCIGIFLGQTIIFIDQDSQNIVLINNTRTTWPYEILSVGERNDISR